jgi:hypothetical protein
MFFDLFCFLFFVFSACLPEQGPKIYLLFFPLGYWPGVLAPPAGALDGAFEGAAAGAGTFSTPGAGAFFLHPPNPTRVTAIRMAKNSDVAFLILKTLLLAFLKTLFHGKGLSFR